MLSLLDRNLTRAHLVHSYPDKGQQSNAGIVRLQDDDCPRGHDRQVPLRENVGHGVNATTHTRVPRALDERLAIVRAILDKRPLDGPRNGRVPAVIGQHRQKRLVDGSARELVGQRIVGEHVDERVWLALCEEPVAELDMFLDVEDLGLARVGDDVVVVGRCDGACGVVDSTGEEVWAENNQSRNRIGGPFPRERERKRARLPSQDVKPMCLALGSHTNISSNRMFELYGAFATWTMSFIPVSPNQPPASLPRTAADSGVYLDVGSPRRWILAKFHSPEGTCPIHSTPSSGPCSRRGPETPHGHLSKKKKNLGTPFLLSKPLRLSSGDGSEQQQQQQT